MKQAKIKVDVTVEIVDDEDMPDGSKVCRPRVHTNFKGTLADLLFEAGEAHRDREKFGKLLDNYVYLAVLEIADVPFHPLTTEVALELQNCEIVEVDK